MAETESAAKKILITVAAGLILIVLTKYLGPWACDNVLIPCAKAVGRFGSAVGHHLTSSAAVPWWLLWILIVLSVIVLFQIAASLTPKAKSVNPAEDAFDWHGFTEFVYKGVKWVWRYDNGHISAIIPRCPVCSCLLQPKRDMRGDPSMLDGIRDMTFYWCDHCKLEKHREDGNHKAIVNRVQIEIDRLVVSGEWKNHVRQQITAGSES